jgi:NADH-quinone oxidoreductase subunit M
MGLSKSLPFAAVTFVLAGLASMGLPGFSGFVAELEILLGAWRAFPSIALVTGLGILISVAYMLRAMQKAFFGAVPSPVCHADQPPLEPVSVPERLGAALLLGVALLVGLYPRLLLDVIVPSFDSSLFDWLRKGGGR